MVKSRETFAIGQQVEVLLGLGWLRASVIRSWGDRDGWMVHPFGTGIDQISVPNHKIRARAFAEWLVLLAASVRDRRST